MTHVQKNPPPVEVPAESLEKEILVAIIESFVLREGTDYGAVEVSLSKKIEQIEKQIQKGDVKVVFDPAAESVTLMTKKQFTEALQKSEYPTL